MHRNELHDCRTTLCAVREKVQRYPAFPCLTMAFSAGPLFAPRPHLLRSVARTVGARPLSSSPVVTCMAAPRRQAKVAKQIEREVGNLLLTDKVLQKAVCPEKRIGIDSALSAIASVTEVEVSNDLTIAKVYLSVFSDEEGKRIAITGLKRLEGYVRKHIATSMNLRMAPEVRFLQDDTIERAEEVYALLDSIKADRQSEAASDTNDHTGTSATATNGSSSGGPLEEPIEIDTDGDVASIQLTKSGSDSSESSEKPLVSVRKVRLPGASQRTPSLKLRRRT